MTETFVSAMAKFSRRCAKEPVLLTYRQSQICHLVVQGLEAKEIGKMLALSPRTVEFHAQAVYRKYGVHNAVQLVRKVYDIPDDLEEEE